MLSFTSFLESKMFSSLIPQTVKSKIGEIEKEVKKLTDKYDKQIINYKFCELPDTFSDNPIKVFFADASTYYGHGYKGQGCVVNKPDNCVIIYCIPMTNLDTVYHEIVHAYDPKFRKNLINTRLPDGTQNNLTYVEIDAKLSGIIHTAKQKLNSMLPEERKRTLDEFKNFIRELPETEPWTMPHLLAGLPLDSYRRNKRMWRKVLTTIYNSLLSNN